MPRCIAQHALLDPWTINDYEYEHMWVPWMKGNGMVNMPPGNIDIRLLQLEDDALGTGSIFNRK